MAQARGHRRRVIIGVGMEGLMEQVQKYLLLDGLKAGVSVKADAGFYAALPYIFSHWSIDIVQSTTREMFADVDMVDGRYRLSSPFMEKPGFYPDPLNTICAIVAELAWARLREDPSLLCIHGAAAKFSNRLVVFPATKKAGKSTLSVAMAAAGIRLFTDDFLPLSIGDDGRIQGLSCGVSPRLRLPLPQQIGARAMAYLAARETLSNAQYTYVAPRALESASFNESAPIGGIVFLDRQDGAVATLGEITTADALKTLIHQNFSRAGNASDILAMLECLVQSLPVFMLRYDEAEPAIVLLNASFKDRADPLPDLRPRGALCPTGVSGPQFVCYQNVDSGQFAHADGVHVVSADGKRFLTGSNGQSIHYLNEGAALIWQILDEPTSVAEGVEILCAAFPAQSRAQIEGDVLRCFRDFGKNGLLKKQDNAVSGGPDVIENVREFG